MSRQERRSRQRRISRSAAHPCVYSTPTVSFSVNTLIHIGDARFAADVSAISLDPHAAEHLLHASSRPTLLSASVQPIEDEDDPLFDPHANAFGAELWMRQEMPDLRSE